MRDVYEFDLERADGDGLLRLDLDQPRLLFQTVLFQAPLHQGQRERRAVHRHVDLGKEVGHGSDVVLVAVGQNHGSHLRLVILKERQVGHHQIDAQQLGVGEHHSAIDYDNIFAIADGGHVHAELAESAQGYYLQLQISHSSSLSSGQIQCSHEQAVITHAILEMTPISQRL